MEIRRTPALILKSIDWSETSKILTCFSKDFGKISLMVRGAKRPKSNFRGLCEPLHHIDLIYDFKEQRDLNIVREIDLNTNYSDALSQKYEHFYYTLGLMELLDVCLEDSDANQEIFLSIIKSLDSIKSCKHPESFFFKFYLELIHFLGYQFSFKTCGSCGMDLSDTFQYQIEYGIVCRNCENELIANQINQKMFACFKTIQLIEYDNLDKISINKKLQSDMLHIINSFVNYHLNTKIRLKSLSYILNT